MHLCKNLFVQGNNENSPADELDCCIYFVNNIHSLNGWDNASLQIPLDTFHILGSKVRLVLFDIVSRGIYMKYIFFLIEKHTYFFD